MIIVIPLTIISMIISDDSLTDAIDESTRVLKTKKNSKETLAAIDKAIEMVNKATPVPCVIEGIGAGWVAEEALAISLYCASVVKDDFKKGILLSVNHSGDSDSTGSITGNILGALLIFEIRKKRPVVL
jgi:ADP-ribosylglycohydrolase